MKKIKFLLFLIVLSIICIKDINVLAVEDEIPKKVILDKPNITAFVGVNTSIEADIYPNHGYNVGLIYESDNEEVATVDANGIIIPKSTGIVNITVKSEVYPELQSKCRVEVKEEDSVKVNVTSLHPYVYMHGDSGRGTVNSVYVDILNFDKDKNYTVEWKNSQDSDAYISYINNLYTGERVENNIADELCNTYPLVVTLNNSNDKNISGYLKIIENDGEKNNKTIYIQELNYHTNYDDGPMSESLSIKRYNLKNLRVGDRLHYNSMSYSFELIYGIANVSENEIEFITPGVVKFAVNVLYQREVISRKEYTVNVSENISNNELKILNNNQYLLSSQGIPIYFEDCSYGLDGGYRTTVKNDNSLVYKYVSTGSGGGGLFQLLRYDERFKYQPLQPEYDEIGGAYVAFYPGEETILIKDSNGNIIREATVNAKELVFDNNIPEILSSQVDIYSQLLQFDGKKVEYLPIQAKLVGTIDILSGEENIEISNLSEEVQGSKFTATISPKANGKVKLKIKYTLEYIGRQDEYNTAPIDSTVNEKIFSKAWYEKKYGEISYEKTVEFVTQVEGELLKGDMNKDGKVNATDAAMVLDRYKYKNATEQDMQIGDMNNDGKLNATDAALILDVYKNNK